MDFFSHGFWTFLFFHKKSYRWWAVFFGLLPDLISWSPLLVLRLFTGTFVPGPPHIAALPEWVWTLYGIGHSMILFLLAIVIVWYFLKKFPWVMLGYGINILIDIPTHSREFLPTPFLWPFSEWYFPGFSWGQKWFMILNYSLLAALYLFFFLIKPNWRKWLKILKK
ncbi:hypothetical protein KY339_02605 [Candidatus Woesearchaeota archaeon]|nr:hypothetical protein [Candidatus Woesearchaeota archaeon]